MAETTISNVRVAAAREVIRTHDRLRRVEAGGERFPLGPGDVPVDGRGWLARRYEQYRLALSAWQQAIEQLARVLGPEFPGRHPAQFRPVCEQILARADAAVVATRPGNEDARSAALRAMRGERNTTRAEQFRARGMSDREIARRIGVGLATVRTWFHLQDELILTGDHEQPELDAVTPGGAR